MTSEAVYTGHPKWGDKLSPLPALCTAILLSGLALRGYEYVTVSANYLLPESAPALYAAGAAFDILFLAFVSLLLSLVYLALSRLNRRLAFWIVSLAAWVFLAISVALVQYYANVLTPLGSDFFAYNWIEVSDTVRTSADLTAGRLIPFLLFPALFSLLFAGLERIRWKDGIAITTAAILCLSAVGFGLFYPEDADYDREVDYTLTVNKTRFFLGHAVRRLVGTSDVSAYSGPEYPLLHESQTEDVLGPLFDLSDRPPNLVFIIVESFGGTFMPPHDSFGGFTPFLDSLATESLYWTHFLSTSGRSFNAQPSIFGSLPYGEQGFMEMGFRAPDHHSLISILNENGYHTAYFCGYESRFDKLDQFLERQNIDLLVDASRYPDSYAKMDEIEGGFTWGYSDKDTYRRAFDFIGPMDPDTPRLDIFFSLNFHEPFIIPETDLYRERFTQRLDGLGLSPERRFEYEQYESIFSALLYTDDAIRELMARYRARDDYEETIFIITGDHRMIPVPHRNRIDRYYVPFVIYSPMLREPVRFNGVSSHLDVTPTLLAMLRQNWELALPDSAHWLGRELNVGTELTDGRDIPFMRNKNEMPDYLSDNLYISGSQLFELEEGMLLRPLQDPDLTREIAWEFAEFRRLNRYVTSENRLIRMTPEMAQSRDQLMGEEQFFNERNLDELNPEELFFRARELAFTDQYDEARAILRRLLRDQPNFHDARLLLGRTYGWDGDYERAMSQFEEVLRRNPDLPDVYSAMADLYFWMNEPEQSIDIASAGLSVEPDFVPLLFRSARAYRQMGNESEAQSILDEALRLDPDNNELLQLQNQLQ